MDYAGRLERLNEAMMGRDLDGIVYGVGPNFHYFTGLPVSWQREAEPEEPACLLVMATGNPPRVIMDSACACVSCKPTSPVEMEVAGSPDELNRMLRRLLKGKRVGISRPANHYLRGLVGQAVPGAEIVDAEELGANLRVCKDADEIATLREAVVLTDRVMEEVVDHIRPGITQPQLQARIAETGLALGAQDVSFPSTALYVKSGTKPTEDPFTYPPEKGLVPGTSIAFDFGFVLDGYCSDFGRSFYCGLAPEHISGAYRALQESQCHLISEMKPGQLTLGELFGVIEEALDERGYGDRLRARLPEGNLGHQIGVDLHEDPWLRRGCDVPLKPGMVMAIEPKLWLPGEYYLRVEDIVLITDDGAESLTAFDREMFELPA